MTHPLGKQNSSEFYMPPPPDDLRLNVFLLNLADELKEADVDKIKSLLTGPGGFGLGVLEEMKSARDLFTHLKTTKMISKENIVVLQALIWHIGRKDLYLEMVKLAGELDGALHTVSPVGKPEEGYKYVRFHIHGGKGPNKAQLETLRDSVAIWMCVPREYVTVHGIEPSGSCIITFMVPEICIRVLIERAKTHGQWFTSLDIDRFEVDGDVVTIDADSTKWPSQEPDPLEKENQRLREKVEHLEESKERLEISSIKQNRENEALHAKCNSVQSNMYQMLMICQKQQRFLFGLFIMALVYLNLFKKSFMEGTSLGLGLKNGAVSKMESAIVAYKRNMEAIRRKCYDVDLIGELLDSFRVITLRRYIEELRLTQFILSDYARNDHIAMRLRNFDLEVENSLLRLKLTELSLMSDNGESIEGKPVPTLLRNGSFSKTPASDFPLPAVDIQLGIKPEFLELLRDVSNRLHKRDRDKLMKPHKDISFTAQERSVFCKDSDKNKLLEVTLVKHIQAISARSKEVYEQPEKIIRGLLEEVNRQDLIQRLDAYVLEQGEAAWKQAGNSPLQVLVHTQFNPWLSC